MTVGLSPASSWINQKRLRDYPRLMLLATWLILLLNLLFRSGWQGGLGQIIGGDFIMFYATGLTYNDSPEQIYNYDLQTQTQQSLVAPTVLPGINPYMNPPYVAPLYTLLTTLPLTWSYLSWTVLMIIFAILAAIMMMSILPNGIVAKGLSRGQLIILVMSFFPLIESFQAGQNSALTLFLMTCVIFLTIKERNFLAGIFAGFMIYKPQYILGFLILWVVWKNWKALAGFSLVAIFWIGSFYIAHGFGLFRTYQELSQVFVMLPYIEGFPAYILVTLYGLLSTLFPQSAQPYTYAFSQFVLGMSIIALAMYAFSLRHKSTLERIPAITLAILLPLFATPYALLHDLVLVIPAFVLWAHYQPSRSLLLAAIATYFGAFFLTLVSALSHIALNAMLVIGLIALIILCLVKRSPRPAQGSI
jgi:hypothetical protein